MKRYVGNDLAARHVIKNGLVKINGVVITNEDIPADDGDRIEISCTDLKEDRDFWELREIDEEYSLVKKADTVIFMGSSGEGMPKFCKSRGGDVYIVGPTAPDGFRHVMENPLRTTYDKIFDKIRMKSDVFFIDTGLGLIKSFEILQNNISLCKDRGYVVMVLTEKDLEKEESENIVSRFFSDVGIEFLRSFKGKGKAIFLGRRVK